MSQPLPEPRDWLKIQLAVTRGADREIIAALEDAAREINILINSVSTETISGEVRRQQLMLIRAHIKREQAMLWRKIGEVIKARRLEAAEGAIRMGAKYDAFILRALEGGSQIAAAIAQSEIDLARTGIDRMIARQGGASYVPLSDRVYTSEVGVGQAVDRMVNSALAQGLSAKEFAKRAEPFINPHTPGGLRYAALRLGRTEINNAAHASAVSAQIGKPWVEGMGWHLSGSHPKPDICDQLARGGPAGDGVYRPKEVPSKPHPQCFCYVTPKLLDENAFLDNLVVGKYNAYLERFNGGGVIRIR